MLDCEALRKPRISLTATNAPELRETARILNLNREVAHG